MAYGSGGRGALNTVARPEEPRLGRGNGAGTAPLRDAQPPASDSFRYRMQAEGQLMPAATAREDPVLYVLLYASLLPRVLTHSS